MSDIKKQISEIISQHQVVLFMKGNRDFPMCGFSGTVVKILDHLQIPFKDIDILQSEEMRQAIKEFSDWPTIPQLYVEEEFVGGCDIIREMFEKGELTEFFKDKKILEKTQ